MSSTLRDLPVGSFPNAEDLEGVELHSDEAGSVYSSVAAPFRDGEIYTTFPIYSRSGTFGEVETCQAYSCSLLPLGNGFPLFNVAGDLNRSSKHLAVGALLGDVGFFDTEGDFRFLCNIFFPKSHEMNSNLPMENFVCLPRPPPEDIVAVKHLPPQTIMISDRVEAHSISEFPLKYEFTTSAPEAAVLVLPKGAIREDIINFSNILPYLNEHAHTWYEAYNGNTDKTTAIPFANGTMCVVIGIDRAESCAMATLYGKETKPTKIIYTQEVEGNASPWSDDNKRRQSEYQHHDLPDGKYFPIFLRVLSVALSHDRWSERVAQIERHYVPYYGLLPTGSEPGLLHTWIRRFFSVGPSIHRSKKGLSILFHPSIILLHILMMTNPSAGVGAVPDSVWISQLDKQYLTHAEVVALIRRVVDNYDLVTVDGVAQFTLKTVATTSAHARKSQRLVSRVFPWIWKSSKEQPNVALQNMAKVLGIPRL